jgi:GNAT superfamily N-acetyltransferase
VIRSVAPDEYGDLLALQIECIRGLDSYEPSEIEAWVHYLDGATAERFAGFENRAFTDSDDEIRGFVSWSNESETRAAAIECLYVREICRGQGIGELLLNEAESQLLRGTISHVRSTLNARSFYEQNGYIFRDESISRAGFAIALLDKVIMS